MLIGSHKKVIHRSSTLLPMVYESECLKVIQKDERTCETRRNMILGIQNHVCNEVCLIGVILVIIF